MERNLAKRLRQLARDVEGLARALNLTPTAQVDVSLSVGLRDARPGVVA